MSSVNIETTQTVKTLTARIENDAFARFALSVSSESSIDLQQVIELWVNDRLEIMLSETSSLLEAFLIGHFDHYVDSIVHKTISNKGE
jgi:hypothetical protein